MKTLKILLFLTILWCFCIACQKAPVYSKVEGMWLLKTITTLENNQTQDCERLFYSITRTVTEVAEKQGAHGYGAYIGKTEYDENGKVLILKDFKIRRGTNDNGKSATADQLKPFGIINPQETYFHILKSNRHQMILQSDYARLELRKF